MCFIHKEDKNKKNNEHDEQLNKRSINKQILKAFDDENDAKNYKLEQEKMKNEQELKKKEKYKQKIKEKKEEFKKLSKESQQKILEENKRKNNDFLYIDENKG